ncbi:MAG: hypothetical protein ACR2PL_23515 [Dehalococcoidia bacterium]
MRQDEFDALEVGDRLFWHSPEPPYPLWYAVVRHRDRYGESQIYVPALREQATLDRADQVHHEIPRGCRYCMPIEPGDAGIDTDER